MDLSEEDDTVKAAVLRHQFQNTSFNYTWKNLQLTGWTHKHGTGYEAPAGVVTILNAHDVNRLLDRGAIPVLRNHLQAPSSYTTEASPTSKKLRQELIQSIKVTALKSSSKAISNSNSQQQPLAMGGSVVLGKRTTRSRKSVATFDMGADLCLRKPRKQLKSRGTEISSRSFPSAQQVAAVYEVNNNKNLHGNMGVYERFYADWLFILSTGRSLLLYGSGSKRSVMNEFASATLEPVGDVLTIEGYDVQATVGGILALLVSSVLKGFKDDEDEALVVRAKAIAKAIAIDQMERHKPLYLVIHNLDGFTSSREDQEAIAELVLSSFVGEIQTIRLVCSIDHVNASTLLWDTATSKKFNFVWKLLQTQELYIEECKKGMQVSKKSRQAGRHLKKDGETKATEESMIDVLSTLAPRHAEVIELLAKLLLKLSSDDQGVRLGDLLKECKSHCVVSSITTLSTYVSELVDHGLVVKCRGGDTALQIPHGTPARLGEILGCCRELAESRR